MRTSLWSFSLIVLFAAIGAVIGAPPIQAQGVCPGEALYVDSTNGQDSPTCGPDGQPPCQTLSFAIGQIGDCREPLQIWDSNHPEWPLYVANLKSSPPWGQIIGVASGLVAGLVLGYSWRKSRVAATAAAFVFVVALWVLLGSARPASAQGVCPGSAVHFRNTGANSATCAGAGNPCQTLAWSRQRASQCSNEVRIYRKRLIGWKLVDVYRPPAGNNVGNAPCDDGLIGLPCRVKQALERTGIGALLVGLLIGFPVGVIWHRMRVKPQRT